VTFVLFLLVYLRPYISVLRQCILAWILGDADGRCLRNRELTSIETTTSWS